jgi:hypothetical protein
MRRGGKEKRPPELFPAAFLNSWLPTLDNLQLSLDANDGNAQFLPTVAGSALWWVLSMIEGKGSNPFPSTLLGSNQY